jgi:hypothetical protein
MESFEQLLQLCDHFKSLLVTSKPTEAKALLTWLQHGGLQRLEPDLTEFLQGALINPPLVAQLKERWNRAYDLDSQLQEEGEALFGTDDVDGYYLAGLGYTLEQLRQGVPEELKIWNLARIESRQSGWGRRTEEASFLEAFGEPFVSERYANVRPLWDYIDVINPPFPKLVRGPSSWKDNLCHYMAGAGMTPEKLATSTKVERAKLLAAFEAAGEERFNAFIAGFEY